ncbi:hypothetical protein ACWC19_38380, partial [Streptomyces sp. 900105245]
MRALPPRRLASTVLCAAVLVGITGPAVVAADSSREHARAASPAFAPAAEKLLAQVRALDHTGTVPRPVIDLLEQSLEKGKLPAAEARRLGDAAKKALAEAAAHPASAVAPSATATPTASAATPTAPAASTAPTTPAEPAAATPAAS